MNAFFWDQLNFLKRSISSGLKYFLKVPYRFANLIFAKKPKFIIIGTGRCGTKFTASYLEKAGITCSHEQYFTTFGPKLRNAYRPFWSSGDSSWLAVPYLPDTQFKVVHQVRHPLKVIASFYRLGFFDPKFSHRWPEFFEFMTTYFQISEDPLHSAMRWYIEWNSKCEMITSNRYQVEKFTEILPQFSNWIGLRKTLPIIKASKKINSRKGRIIETDDSILNRLRCFSDYSELVDFSIRYGYDLN